MDTKMRTWEKEPTPSSQNSQDRMHTEFIKTIREVENYQDASTGNKFEMTSGYNHAWSRGDGTSFILATAQISILLRYSRTSSGRRCVKC